MPHSDLFGTTWVSQPEGTGRFRCPRCADDRDFTRTALRPWIVLVGRTVAPMGRTRRYLTCQECGHAFRAGPRADTVDDGAGPLSEDERALLAVVAAVVFSDSAVRSSERREVGRVLHHYLPPGEHLDASELLRDARQRWGDPIARLERLRGLVDDSVRSRIVEAAYRVCTADGELHREESKILDRIGTALDLSPRRVRQAVTEARRQPLGSGSGR